MTDDLAAIEPCPFCGGDGSAEGKVQYSPSYEAFWADGSRITTAYFANCVRCQVQSHHYQTKAEAIAAWNTRTQSALEARVRELEAENAQLRGSIVISRSDALVMIEQLQAGNVTVVIEAIDNRIIARRAEIDAALAKGQSHEAS